MRALLPKMPFASAKREGRRAWRTSAASGAEARPSPGTAQVVADPAERREQHAAQPARASRGRGLLLAPDLTHILLTC